jgi:phage baseplate assembly protein V
MRNITARGEVSMVQDGSKMQTNQIKVLDGELIDGAERAQQYGLTSHPLPGAESFIIFVGADRSHPVIIAVDDRRHRPNDCAAGEVKVYTHEGDYIHLKSGNEIEIKTKKLIIKAEDEVDIETNLFRLKANAIAMSNKDGGDVTAALQGSLAASDDIQANGGAVSLRGHTHKDSGGSGNSGTPNGG